ncbi:SIS domain-containing protein [Helcococcus ovis]|uniref:Sugar isomerase domain-containing protein n=2 Tax=Helcococcus ovis TaxID=72026 RepID=A0A4R9C2X8_9FIRM|nr:SIS domain-containing protein [Helcococcus ovis]TFF63950.1 sugar isomerase domain-containing protein [Helcococcus ovis]TFF64998.1 sugar isomerase domain-containing protein [Helcococcus ovis]TFF68667.1 sugar isomerase domain-containing protein [Helcococcus ovis]WNZ01607.1 SIS domain-containing protein [Helcococcus ovis]
MFEYFDKIKKILYDVEKNECENIKKFKDCLVEATINKNNIYIFGASHAGILVQEMYYRAGGLITVNPIFGREISLTNQPITITSKMERLHGYGSILASTIKFKKNDLLILHSVSGRNPVTIELGIYAKEKGVKIIVLTNLNYSKNSKSRHKSGKLLYEIADVIIDNHGDIGDATISIKEGLNVAPTSTVIGATILNTVISETAKELLKNNIDPLPFFYSANLDGGDEKNKLVAKYYKNNIIYKF